MSREINGYQLTDEQDNVVTAAQLIKDIILFAFAGAGKTSTLKAVAKYHAKQSLYIAFNSAIAKEASLEFPRNVECRTAHSLAFRAIIMSSNEMKRKYENANNGNKLNNNEIKEELALDYNKLGVQNFQLLVAITRSLENFMRSADKEVKVEHVSSKIIGWSDDDDQRQKITSEIIKYTQKLWDMMSDPNHSMGVTHDGYLKKYQLSNPKIKKELIMIDEAQDCNAVLLDIINQQKCQKIFVGDPHQAIYGWRGAVDAMKLAKGVRMNLTKSFRFGANIAEIANKCLVWKEEESLIEGLGRPQAPTRKKQDVLLCRANMTIFSKAIEAIEKDKKVYIEGGIESVAKMIEGAYWLKENQPFKCKAPELIEFANWDQMKLYADESEDVDLNRLIRFIDKHKQQTLNAIRKLRQTINTNGDSADLILSSAHKSKGLEWDTVRLADDFKLPTDTNEKGGFKPFFAEDMNLLYVAVTRAKRLTLLSQKQKEYFATVSLTKTIEVEPEMEMSL